MYPLGTSYYLHVTAKGTCRYTLYSHTYTVLSVLCSKREITYSSSFQARYLLGSLRFSFTIEIRFAVFDSEHGRNEKRNKYCTSYRFRDVMCVARRRLLNNIPYLPYLPGCTYISMSRVSLVITQLPIQFHIYLLREHVGL